MKTYFIAGTVLIFAICSCKPAPKTDGKFCEKDGEVKIIQLNPTHSHAAAVQSEQLSQIDTNVYVYTPESGELDGYFGQIKSGSNHLGVKGIFQIPVYKIIDF